MYEFYLVLLIIVWCIRANLFQGYLMINKLMLLSKIIKMVNYKLRQKF
jgi:hypothetical protein